MCDLKDIGKTKIDRLISSMDRLSAALDRHHGDLPVVDLSMPIEDDQARISLRGEALGSHYRITVVADGEDTGIRI